MKLKIFSDRSFLSRGSRHIEMLYPFWGKPSEDDDPLKVGCFDRYMELGRSFFEMVSLTEADIAVLPHNWNQKDQVQQGLAVKFIEKVNQADKQLVIFALGDRYRHIAIQKAIVIRSDLNRNKKKSNEFASPALNQDIGAQFLSNQLCIRQKQIKPVVGFCGYAPPLGMSFNQRKLKAIVRWGASHTGMTRLIPDLVGFAARARALYVLLKSNLVESNFIIRNQFAFSNEVGKNLPGGSVKSAIENRQEFIKNMVESDYILCARGAENYSIRFYETLSCGRIPILIDTNCVLPYDFGINWKKYCVWVDESDISRVAEKVVNFHDRLSPKEFIDLQYECRRLWEQWVSPEGYFSNFYRHLKTPSYYLK